jgi:hypothetical protein
MLAACTAPECPPATGTPRQGLPLDVGEHTNLVQGLQALRTSIALLVTDSTSSKSNTKALASVVVLTIGYKLTNEIPVPPLRIDLTYSARPFLFNSRGNAERKAEKPANSAESSFLESAWFSLRQDSACT